MRLQNDTDLNSLKCQGLWPDTHGATLVLVAITISALIGFAALGAETGLWYAIKRQVQSAADMSAISGAFERAAGMPYSDICAIAANAAAQNGFAFQSFTCPTSSPGCTNPPAGQMCANNPPVFALYPGDPVVGDVNSVEVILTRQQGTVLTNLPALSPIFPGLNLTSVTIQTRAVAKAGVAGVACSLALATTGQNIKFNGTPSICLGTTGAGGSCSPTCGIASDSNSPTSVDFTGTTSLMVAWFDTVGSYKAGGNVIIPTVNTNSSPVSDPYSCGPPQIGCAGHINYTPPVTTQTLSLGAVNQAGLYVASGNNAPLDFKSGNTVLCPGIYYLNGENAGGAAFSVSNGATVRVGGTADGCSSNGGVTFIAYSTAAVCGGHPPTATCGGGFQINGNSGTLTCGGVSNLAVCLSAPTSSTPSGCTTSNPYPTPCIPSGLLFYQDPTTRETANKGASTINAPVSLTGTIYIPGSFPTAPSVTYQGNANSTCTVIIANTIQFSGTTTMSASQSGCSAAGVTPPELIKITVSG